MDISKLIASIKATAASILPGASEAVKAGESLADFVISLAPTLAEDDQRKLQAALPALLEKMNRDVDQALRDLGAPPG